MATHAGQLEIGKLPNELLAGIIGRPGFERSEILTGPGIGEDCAVLDLEGDLLVISTDPITGTDLQAGTLAVHVAMNDLGSAGAEPVALMVTLLCPPGTTVDQIDSVMAGIRREADRLQVSLAGGHTEVTDAVNRTVVSMTAIGRVARGRAVTTRGAVPGDGLYMTKAAGLEGTAILASTFEPLMTRTFGREWTDRAKECLKDISVVAEGRRAAALGCHAMHDVTEGGVLGAVWEMCEASGTGCIIDAAAVPIRPETEAICRKLSIDPMKLISSGSLLIAADPGSGLLEAMRADGFDVHRIGTVAAGSVCLLCDENGRQTPIAAPESDALFHALAEGRKQMADTEEKLA